MKINQGAYQDGWNHAGKSLTIHTGDAPEDGFKRASFVRGFQDFYEQFPDYDPEDGF